MVDLDNLQEIKKLDKANALESICRLADQCKQAWEEAHKIFLPPSYLEVENIVCAGMGGSAYGVRLVKSLYDSAKEAKIPLEMVNGYSLPGYIDKDSLVILSSYSGNTEETLVCAQQAKAKGAKITGITSGGKLGNFFRENKYPAYIFEPKNNPSRQPRIGQGYMQIGLIALLARIGRIPLVDDEIEKMVYFLRRQQSKINQDVPLEKNPVKQLAHKLWEKVPVVIVADFLAGAAHAIRNPFNETAKQFALYFVVPELNHHLIEGLKFPKQNKNLLLFLFIHSSLYHPENSKRLDLTRKIVKKNGITVKTVKLSGSSTLIQSMELIQFGSFVSFYLAMLNRVDPSKVPWVDFFKEQLKRKEYD